MEIAEMLEEAYRLGQRSVLITLARVHENFPHATTAELLATSAQALITLWEKDGATIQ